MTEERPGNLQTGVLSVDSTEEKEPKARKLLTLFDLLDDAQGISNLLQETPSTDVNATNEAGEPALVVAARGFDDAFDILLSFGADLSQADTQGLTPFLQACHCSQINILEKILKESAHLPLATVTHQGYTCLKLAAGADTYGPEKLAVVKRLLELDLSLSPQQVGEALVSAASMVEAAEVAEEIARYLVSLYDAKKAEVKTDETDHSLQSLLLEGVLIAAKNGHDQTLGKLLTIGAGLTPPLHVNHRFENGQTLLHWAAYRKQEDVLRLLMGQGNAWGNVDLQLQNSRGVMAHSYCLVKKHAILPFACRSPL